MLPRVRRGAYDATLIDSGQTPVYAESGWTLDMTDWILSTDPEVGILDWKQDFPENFRFWIFCDTTRGSEKYGRYFALSPDVVFYPL